jgi:hypothetical protein
MQQLSLLLIWLDGKKTKIAFLVYLIQDQILPIWFDPMPVTLDKTVKTAAIVLGALGLAHAGAKAVTGRPQ